MYFIEYLPKAKSDIEDIVRYISHKLKNPQAALPLAEKIIKEIDKLEAFPYSHQVYVPVHELKHEYRKLIVNNYLIFYWIEEEEKRIIIARIIYGKRDYNHLLN